MNQTICPRRGPIVVVGSINMDLVCPVQRMPAPGETILGADLATLPGGKGANQAVAAARLGGEVHFVGRVGDDVFGQRLLDGLRRSGVSTRHVKITPRTSSGCALILVDRHGENSIVVSPGANHRLTPDDVDAAAPLFRRAAVVMVQLEIPYPAVRRALELGRRLGACTILDPAPAPPRGLPRSMFAVDILSPNQAEAAALLARGARQSADPRDHARTGKALLARGPRCVVLKLGAAGAMIVTGADEPVHVGAFPARVVDTTAAGDAFTGALAVALAEGMALPDAVRFANAAGALCCEGFGAQPSLPDRRAVDRRLAAASARGASSHRSTRTARKP